MTKTLKRRFIIFTMWAVTCLLVFIVLAINSFTMGGAPEGLKFYLMPDMDQVMEVGWWNVISGAMSQAFFTLSIGMGSMAIFGSYINKDRALLGEAITVGKKLLTL